MPRGKVIDEGWLRAHYPMMTDIDHLLADHEREFGWRPSKQAVYVKANRLGIHKAPVDGRGHKCERIVRWSKQPEMERWMLENDHGERIDVLVGRFMAHFGFRLTRTQVSLFRASHGTQARHSHGGGRERRPVGYERESKDGYVVIKFKEHPDVPLSKDNWKLKHVWVWEREHGPLPEGHSVYFADGDNRNFEPSNLVAVPNRLVGQLNALKSEGVTWHDAESLTTAIAMAEIRIARNEAMAKQERVCKCCGRRFTNWERYKTGGSVKSTICPECGHKGRKPPRYDRAEIRRLRARGMTYREISERVGCTKEHAFRICKG
jgi:hypothetical protein